MDWLLDPFQFGFQQRALLGGIVAAALCAVVGTWLVLRGMSFFGDAVVHGVLPGIALAVVIGGDIHVGAAVAALVMMAGVGLVHRTTTLKEDTAIGLLFVGMMALGVVIISLSDSYTGSLTAILFGDALGLTVPALTLQATIAVAVGLLAALLHRPLLALSFSEAKAQALGMRPRLTHALLLVMIGAAVIGSFQAVGTVLVFGLLVGPPATAALVTRTVPQMMMVAVLVGSLGVTAGLVLSYHWGTAGSATMALVPIVLFFVVLLTRAAVLALAGRRVRRRGPETAAPAVAAPAAPAGSAASATPAVETERTQP
ncbi:zinc ABC transporter permease AztB [Micrococcus sp.]|uniref:zinc ABC transporter permease AztB n=1 Tax=Micrococcus sp. TaxID=1271 RepID=UPI002A913888|nr:zinc ABC transporter permease AztB [Micrococcus sp.]MDY6055642.1 zinc ABC transporter permease AztB [Micrococcus sp.]